MRQPRYDTGRTIGVRVVRTGGIVLCGGYSSRMGRPKAWLPFGDEVMLPRVVRILREVVEPVVVVAAPGQDVPLLPHEVAIVRDEIEGKGPLAGLAAGLGALAGKCDAVYLSACDVPFLKAAFVRRMIEEPTPPAPLPEGKGEQEPGAPSSLDEVRGSVSPFPSGRGAGGVGSSRGAGGVGPPLATVPRINGFLHPLAAVYRAEVLSVVRGMLAANALRMTDLFTLVPTRAIGPEELVDVDPELASLRNLNTPEEYAAALLRHANADGHQEST